MEVVLFFATLFLLVLYAIAFDALMRTPFAELRPLGRAIRAIAIIFGIILFIAGAIIFVDYMLHGSCEYCPDLD